MVRSKFEGIGVRGVFCLDKDCAFRLGSRLALRGEPWSMLSLR